MRGTRLWLHGGTVTARGVVSVSRIKQVVMREIGGQLVREGRFQSFKKEREKRYRSVVLDVSSVKGKSLEWLDSSNLEGC